MQLDEVLRALDRFSRDSLLGEVAVPSFPVADVISDHLVVVLYNKFLVFKKICFVVHRFLMLIVFVPVVVVIVTIICPFFFKFPFPDAVTKPRGLLFPWHPYYIASFSVICSTRLQTCTRVKLGLLFTGEVAVPLDNSRLLTTLVDRRGVLETFELNIEPCRQSTRSPISKVTHVVM